MVLFFLLYGEVFERQCCEGSFWKKGKRIRQNRQKRRIMEVVRPFEPRRGSILVEQPPLILGAVK